MADDPVQAAMGDFGKWQLATVIMIFVYKLPTAWHTMAVIFLAPKVKQRCLTFNVSDPCSDSCHARAFDRRVFTRTIVTEWDLTCKNKYLASLAQSVVMFGILIGSIAFGIVADRIGRRIPLFVTVFGIILSGLATAYIPWFWLFNIVRFFNAICIGGGLIVSFVSMMEILGKSLRPVLGVTFHIPYWAGHLTLPAFGYYFRDWRKFQLAYSLGTLSVLPILFVVQESPRWLFSTGQVEKAAKILTKAATVNKLPTENIQASLQTALDKRGPGAKKGTILDLFRTRNMLIRTVIISINWFACGVGYYGIAQYAGYLGGDVFVNIAISASFEIPATLICVFLTKYWGRKPTQVLSNLITGVSMVIIAFLPIQQGGMIRYVIAILFALSIGAMCMGFANVYLYSGELFPTVVRNAGMGFASMISRIGSIIAPFIANLQSTVLSSLLFSAAPLIAAVITLFLPETKGQPLPETMEDGENLGKKP